MVHLINCSMMVSLTSLNLGSNNLQVNYLLLLLLAKINVISVAGNKLIGQIPDAFKKFESLTFHFPVVASLHLLESSSICPSISVWFLQFNFYNEQLNSWPLMMIYSSKHSWNLWTHGSYILSQVWSPHSLDAEKAKWVSLQTSLEMFCMMMSIL